MIAWFAGASGANMIGLAMLNIVYRRCETRSKAGSCLKGTTGFAKYVFNHTKNNLRIKDFALKRSVDCNYYLI